MLMDPAVARFEAPVEKTSDPAVPTELESPVFMFSCPEFPKLLRAFKPVVVTLIDPEEVCWLLPDTTDTAPPSPQFDEPDTMTIEAPALVEFDVGPAKIVKYPDSV